LGTETAGLTAGVLSVLTGFSVVFVDPCLSHEENQPAKAHVERKNVKKQAGISKNKGFCQPEHFCMPFSFLDDFWVGKEIGLIMALRR
jgi:hypothetical protein